MTLLRDRIGTCPGCGGPLVKVVDKEDRVWARCTSCGAQIPVEMFVRLKSGKKFVIDEVQGKEVMPLEEHN